MSVHIGWTDDGRTVTYRTQKISAEEAQRLIASRRGGGLRGGVWHSTTWAGLAPTPHATPDRSAAVQARKAELLHSVRVDKLRATREAARRAEGWWRRYG
jgi:hypothetical protein